MSHTQWLRSLAFLVPLALSACSTSPAPPAHKAGEVKGQYICPLSTAQLLPCGTPVDPPDDTTTLTPEALILQAGDVAWYDTVSGQLALNATPNTSSVTVGSVVVAGLTPTTPDGVPPQRVTSVTPQGSGWLVTTSPAQLTDIIEQGSLDVTRTMQASDIELVEPGADDTPNYLMGSQGLLHALAATCSMPGSIYNKSFDSGSLSGCIDLGVKPKVSLKIQNRRLEHFEATVLLSEQAKVQLSLMNASQNLKRHWDLGAVYFASFQVFIGPVPVLLRPYVKFTADLEGNVTAAMSYGIEQNASYEGGLRYDDTGLHTISRRTASINSTPLNWNNVGQFKGDVKASVEARAGIGFWVTIIAAHADGGAYGAVRAYGKATVDAARHPLWQVTAGPQFCVGYDAHLEVLLGLYDKHWSGEHCGNEIRLFELHSPDLGPVVTTPMNTWNRVNLNFNVWNGEVEIVRIDPSGGRTRVGYLTSTGTFDLTSYIDPVDDTEFEVVGISTKSATYRHKLSMNVATDSQQVWSGGTKECGQSWPVGCGSRVEYHFIINKNLALFEAIP